MKALEERIEEIHALELPIPLKKLLQQIEIDIEHEAARITEMGPHYYRRLVTTAFLFVMKGGRLGEEDIARILELVALTNAETMETFFQSIEGFKESKDEPIPSEGPHVEPAPTA